MSKLANKVALVTGGSRGIRGPDHPITISPAEGKVRVSVAGRIIGESTQALRLTGLLLATPRCGHVVARTDHALQLLSLQGPRGRTAISDYPTYQSSEHTPRS
jgi:hypothetical protein